jgi:hypothetical protein
MLITSSVEGASPKHVTISSRANEVDDQLADVTITWRPSCKSKPTVCIILPQSNLYHSTTHIKPAGEALLAVDGNLMWLYGMVKHTQGLPVV